jgi:endoribonuclease Dicer
MSSVKLAASTSSTRGAPPQARKEKRQVSVLPSSSEEDHARPVKKRKVSKPKQQSLEEVIVYDAHTAFQESVLYKKLGELDHDGRLARHFKSARKVYTELGACAADLLWRHVLLGTLSNRQDASLQVFRDVVEFWTFELPNLRWDSPSCDVSSQFMKLIELLRSSEVQNDSFRGILVGMHTSFIHDILLYLVDVLVKRSVTAVMLAKLLRMLDDYLPDLRPIACTDSSPDEVNNLLIFPFAADLLIVLL